jgi:hypothetical protein
MRRWFQASLINKKHMCMLSFPQVSSLVPLIKSLPSVDVTIGHPLFEDSMAQYSGFIGAENSFQTDISISQGSNVWVFGGYGPQTQRELDRDVKFAFNISSKCHDCTVVLFLPYSKPFGTATKLLQSSANNLEILPYGLGRENKAALVHTEISFEPILIRNITEVLAKKGTGVEVLSLNCAGCEFDLLMAVLGDYHLSKSFHHIQVQVHCQKKLGYTKKKYLAIRDMLEETHHASVIFPCLYEQWTRK